MTIDAAIARANELRPNIISEKQKVAWVWELEGKLAEMLGTPPPDPDKMLTADASLAMPHPCDNVYELYLCAMIDFANQETALYANDMAVFNAAMNEARAWWRRNHCPAPSGNWRVM